jgi:uncharacterized protein YPO0396
MSDESLKRMAEKYFEQTLKLAAEAGQMLDKTMDIMESSSKEFVRTVDRETKDNAQEIKRLANEIVGEVRQDIPRVRAELREMEARAREKLREFESK